MSKEIEIFAKKIRRNIVETAHNAGSSSAHIGGALSSVEIVATLFGNVMNYNNKNFNSLIL